MSGGPHHIPSWSPHADGDESDGHVSLRAPIPSSEIDFFSDFFGPLTPVLSPRTAAAEAAAITDAMNFGVGVGVLVGVGGGCEEEVEGSGVGKEERLRASTSDGKRAEEEDDNRDPLHKRKRNRTTEMHNMTERRRRDKIKGKLKALQELIPSAHKLDKAALLDEAIAYVKALQLQVQIMQSNTMCHARCMSPGAMHCLHMPNFSPFSHMGMGYGMGMAGMSRPVHSPITSMPSPVAAANMVPMPGFSAIPTYCPQPMPYASLPEFSAAGMLPLPSPPVLHAGPFSSQ